MSDTIRLGALTRIIGLNYNALKRQKKITTESQRAHREIRAHITTLEEEQATLRTALKQPSQPTPLPISDDDDDEKEEKKASEWPFCNPYLNGGACSHTPRCDEKKKPPLHPSRPTLEENKARASWNEWAINITPPELGAKPSRSSTVYPSVASQPTPSYPTAAYGGQGWGKTDDDNKVNLGWSPIALEGVTLGAVVRQVKERFYIDVTGVWRFREYFMQVCTSCEGVLGVINQAPFPPKVVLATDAGENTPQEVVAKLNEFFCDVDPVTLAHLEWEKPRPEDEDRMKESLLARQRREVERFVG